MSRRNRKRDRDLKRKTHKVYNDGDYVQGKTGHGADPVTGGNKKMKNTVRKHPFFFTVVAVITGLLLEGVVSSGISYICDSAASWCKNTFKGTTVTTSMNTEQAEEVSNMVRLNDTKAMVLKKLGNTPSFTKQYVDGLGNEIEVLIYDDNFLKTSQTAIRLENGVSKYIRTFSGLEYEKIVEKADAETIGVPEIEDLDEVFVAPPAPKKETGTEPVVGDTYGVDPLETSSTQEPVVEPSTFVHEKN